MGSRLYADTERCTVFTWKPVVLIYDDCPLICVFWLWWYSFIGLHPHSRQERAALVPGGKILNDLVVRR